jgi:hypothetical protein
MINYRKTMVFILLIIIFPLILLSQEEIEMNLVDQFHFEYPSFITGLTYDGEYVWMSDIAADSLIAIDKDSGEKVYGFSFPMGPDIYGLTFDGENFWASASQFYLYKISHEDGSIITSFQIPYPMASNAGITELTWHNDILYCMNTSGFSSVIVGIDVETITCVDTIGTAGCSAPTGLTFMNGYFWLNDYIDIKIRKVNPEYGQYEGWFPHYYLCYKYIGITNDGEYMYCSDNFRNVYKYEIIENSAIEENNIDTLEYPIQIRTYPNPSNPEVRIEFSLPNKTTINLEIYNVKGQRIKNIVNNKLLREGAHSFIWNTKDVASGVYFAKLYTKFGNFNQKLTIIK